MLEILKDTDRRLVMTLGRRQARWTRFVLDKDAGSAWFERHGRFLPRRTLSIALDQITTIDSRIGRTDSILLTGGGQQLRLRGERGSTQAAVRRMREFVGLTDETAHVPQAPRALHLPAARIAQAAAAAALGIVAVWLLAQAGGLVADAAAKAGDFVARGAERIQNRFLLPTCDAAESRDAIQELVRDRLGSGAVLVDVAQRGQNGDERFCTGTARRGTQTASVSYRSYWDGWTPKVRLTGEIVTLKLDAARMAAIDAAVETVLSASRNSHRTGQVARHSDPAIDKALATIFGASDLAAEPLAPVEIDKALAWRKAADRIGAVYLLAGTGYDDFATVPLSAPLQRRMRANVVAFADEFGRYADFQMVLLAAVANAKMRMGTATAGKAAIQANGDDIREQLSQAIKGNLIALVYEGHNDGWRMARLTTIGRTAPVAAKFLSKDEAKALREFTLQTVDYFKDTTVRAKAREVAALLAP